LEFDLRAQDAEAVTAAHLHCAPVGQNGPVIAFLFGNVPGGFNVDGQLAAFRLTDANILPAGTQCNPAVTNITDLTAAIAAGNIYVNVHTVAHPNGEIRGQLRP
ncbi:MAG TPA: CHRD domain-containing protein, partial [Candidatus Saccharimonadales bacterium]|nr:CHRD domain-containing protein [Candidatus Saccharimonadales bacterium]